VQPYSRRRAEYLLSEAERHENYIVMATGNGRLFKISNEDIEIVRERVWSATYAGYATRRNNGRPANLRMHREVMERTLGRPLAKEELVDHINGDRLDNRRANLRLCTNRENAFNKLLGRKARTATSRYRGVARHPRIDRWTAAITVDKQCIWIGNFRSEIEAAYVYDQVALQIFEAFASTNFLSGA
jgi:hypothetical protein